MVTAAMKEGCEDADAGANDDEDDDPLPPPLLGVCCMGQEKALHLAHQCRNLMFTSDMAPQLWRLDNLQTMKKIVRQMEVEQTSGRAWEEDDHVWTAPGARLAWVGYKSVVDGSGCFCITLWLERLLIELVSHSSGVYGNLKTKLHVEEGIISAQQLENDCSFPMDDCAKERVTWDIQLLASAMMVKDQSLLSPGIWKGGFVPRFGRASVQICTKEVGFDTFKASAAMACILHHLMAKSLMAFCCSINSKLACQRVWRCRSVEVEPVVRIYDSFGHVGTSFGVGSIGWNLKMLNLITVVLSSIFSTFGRSLSVGSLEFPRL